MKRRKPRKSCDQWPFPCGLDPPDELGGAECDGAECDGAEYDGADRDGGADGGAERDGGADGGADRDGGAEGRADSYWLNPSSRGERARGGGPLWTGVRRPGTEPSITRRAGGTLES